MVDWGYQPHGAAITPSLLLARNGALPVSHFPHAQVFSPLDDGGSSNKIVVERTRALGLECFVPSESPCGQLLRGRVNVENRYMGIGVSYSLVFLFR